MTYLAYSSLVAMTENAFPALAQNSVFRLEELAGNVTGPGTYDFEYVRGGEKWLGNPHSVMVAYLPFQGFGGQV